MKQQGSSLSHAGGSRRFTERLTILTPACVAAGIPHRRVPEKPKNTTIAHRIPPFCHPIIRYSSPAQTLWTSDVRPDAFKPSTIREVPDHWSYRLCRLRKVTRTAIEQGPPRADGPHSAAIGCQAPTVCPRFSFPVRQWPNPVFESPNQSMECPLTHGHGQTVTLFRPRLWLRLSFRTLTAAFGYR